LKPFTWPLFFFGFYEGLDSSMKKYLLESWEGGSYVDENGLSANKLKDGIKCQTFDYDGPDLIKE
jgi:hypothetical protein